MEVRPRELLPYVLYNSSVLLISAFVGLAVIILTYPAPGYIAKHIRDVQAFRMQKTDARIQLVTESKSLALLRDFSSPLPFSYECNANGEIIWLGKENKREGGPEKG
jgi:hypothetical protein